MYPWDLPGAVLPGFDDSAWNNSTPFDGISSAGVQVYRTNFTLDIPSNVDMPLGFQFTPTPSSNYRSLLYVNGWQFGRFVSNLGPQTVFPVRIPSLTSFPPRMKVQKC